MADRDMDSGIELVLDNRKFIIAFVVLIAICGCFFVIGFIEGKRQGLQELTATASGPGVQSSPNELQENLTKDEIKDLVAKSEQESAGEQKLNWYENVTSERAPEVTSKSSTAPVPAKKAEKPEPKPAAKPEKEKPVASPAVKPTGPVTYSVQVGAFRARREAETKGKMLKAKGFDCRIDLPGTPDDLYLVKVGRFSSRAEAKEMQLRLKRSGETKAFIKTN